MSPRRRPGQPVFSTTLPKKGRKSAILSDNQQIALRSHLPELEAWLNARRPWWDWTDEEEQDLTDWRDNMAKELLQSPDSIFRSAIVLGDPKRTPDAVECAMSEFYKNQFYNTWRKAFPQPVAPPAPHAAPQVQLEGTANVITREPLGNPEVRADTFTNTLNGLRRSKLLLQGEYSARDLFIQESGDIIKSTMEDLRATHSGHVEGGALKNMAIKKLWDEVDKTPWITKAGDLASNVKENQGALPWLFRQLTRDIVSRGLTGDTLVKLCVSVRDSDGIRTNSISHVGYDAVKGELFDFGPADQAVREIRGDAWAEEARASFPQFTPRNDIDIPTNKNGVPIFPPVDLKATTVEQLQWIIKSFLRAIYGYSTGSTEGLSLDAIHKDIDKFIDVSTFKVPAGTSLDPKSPLEVMLLASWLVELSATDNPFIFRSTPQSVAIPEDSLHFSPRSPSPAPTIHDEPDAVPDDAAASDVVRGKVPVTLHKTPTPAAAFMLNTLGIPHGLTIPGASANASLSTLAVPTNAAAIPNDTATPPSEPSGLKRKPECQDDSAIGGTGSTQELPTPSSSKKAKRSTTKKVQGSRGRKEKPEKAPSKVPRSTRSRKKAAPLAPSSNASASTSRPPTSSYAKKGSWKGYALADERGTIIPTDENGDPIPGCLDEDGFVIDSFRVNA
ncbi:hypothetical protein NMY22_g4652 [Coprinellus aureogranulatus]|nr:hypothetical protein NMY22_g4652 [Coprinellus aureogranulatus]